MYIVYCILYIAHVYCILHMYIVYCTLYIAHILYIVYCTYEECILYIATNFARIETSAIQLETQES
jgi:hypothetical protein